LQGFFKQEVAIFHLESSGDKIIVSEEIEYKRKKQDGPVQLVKIEEVHIFQMEHTPLS